MSPAIELKGIEKAYRRGFLRKPVVALCGLDLTVQPGEVYALIGPNGAGKTTTFRILLGLMGADRGTGRILDEPLGHRRALGQLGFLPESPCYYPYLTVRELLVLAARLSKVPDAGSAVARALERFGLDRLADRTLRKISKGQLQRVALAQAAVHQPPLFVLDEPMSGLDPRSRAHVKEWIRSMRGEGRTILLATHVLADVEALADRVGLLVDGRIVVEGPAEQLLAGSEEEADVEFALPDDPGPLLEGISASLEERAGLWAATCATGSEVQIGALLTRILARGGMVRSVQRRRRSLESFYVNFLDQEDAGRRIALGGR